MPWILILLAVISFGLTFMTNLPLALTVILLLAALGFLLAAVLGFLSSRLDGNRRDDSKIISPEELRMMREQAAARKSAQNSETSSS